MKVNVSIEVSEYERYVIAKYYGSGRRATRREVRAFAFGAVRRFVQCQVDAFTGRTKSTAARLAPKGYVLEVYEEGGEGKAGLVLPRERQLNLLDGAK